MAAGYVFDLAGGAIAPMPMALIALAALAASVVGMRGRPAVGADEGERLAAVLTGAVVFASFAYFLWLASPSLLPITNGPDVVHHLVLIQVIQRTQHLVHGAALNGYLLEMAGYTPGSHILAALAAAWSGMDAVRIVHPIAALFTALGLGVVYVLAFRSSAGDRRAACQSCAAPLLALVPAAYTVGAFMHFFFFAQVVAGTFACAVLLPVVSWGRLGTVPAVVWCALAAVGVVLAWPVWIAAPVLTVVGMAAVREHAAASVTAVVVAFAPAAILFAVHAAQHRGAAGIITASGAGVTPSLATFGIGFVVCASVGAIVALATRRGAALLVFAFAVLLEAAGLLAVSRAAGSGSAYLSFKMMFLLVPPAAVLGSLALARLSDAAFARLPGARWTGAAAPVIVALSLLPGRVPTHRERGSITDAALAAGNWARDHVPSSCVDYFSGYWLTGYWLHVDVLGNPRVSARMQHETFEFRDAVGKWIEGRGLPYAFVENFDLVPKDARVDMAPLQRFGAAAIVRNLRPARCLDDSASLWTIARPHER